VGRF